MTYGHGIAVDGSGNAYVTGYTASTNFPTTAGAYQTSLGGGGNHDAFVTKLNATGTALIYSTYLGGNGSDDRQWHRGGRLRQRLRHRRHQLHQLPHHDRRLPDQLRRRRQHDAFVTKLNATGTALVYSTYLGGNGDDYGHGIAVDGSGNAYVTGDTASTNFPTTAGAFQTSYGGGNGDAFVTKLNATGTALVYSTYLGGNGNDVRLWHRGGRLRQRLRHRLHHFHQLPHHDRRLPDQLRRQRR